MEKKETTYDRVIKYTGLFGGVQVLTMLMNIVRTKLTAVFLGPEGVGLISRLMNLVELVHHTTDFGLCFSGIKHVSEVFATGNEEKIQHYIRVVRTWCLLLGLLGMMVMIVVSQFITWTNPLYILIMAPMTATMIVTGGEMSILKGTKQLKKVATISIFSALMMVLVCVPLYYFIGKTSIAIALLLSNIVVMFITLHFSSKTYPYQAPLSSKGYLSAGIQMLLLGLGYVVAGFFGKGSEYIIREVIQRHGGLDAVGIYTCGYSIVVTYASYVFTAMEVDYFPRLSGICHDRLKMNDTVNQQIEVYAMLIAPFLSVFVLFMPHIVHLLYSNDFSAAIPMSVCAVMLMFFKAFFGPVEYLALAKGDSKTYMLVELIYDVVVALVVPYSYINFGLAGCGISLSVIGALNTLFVCTFYKYKYGFVFSHRLKWFYVTQFLLLALTIMVVMYDVTDINVGFRWMKWTAGPVLVITSSAVSYRVLKRETTIIEKIKNKLCRKYQS